MSLKAFLLAACSLGIISLTHGQSTDERLKGFNEEKVNTAALQDWEIWGQGEVLVLGDQICLKEDDETKGVMLMSPKSYSGDVVLKFNVLALTAASVVAVLISGSDVGASAALTIPEDYDGNFKLWYEEKENYFFAFKNASHGLTPFVRKNSTGGNNLASGAENKMLAGLYYEVEIGRVEDKLWLSIDNEEVFMTRDDHPLSGGHIGIRIRGTAGFKGACLIKDLTIYSK